MGRATPAQRETSRRRAHARCELIDGKWIATERPPGDHGKRWVANYFGCQCDPCRAVTVRNNPDRRAELRRMHLARRQLIDGCLVATHLADYQHGSPSASDYYGCRCPTRTEAAQARRRRR